jgi:hemoglobin
MLLIIARRAADPLFGNPGRVAAADGTVFRSVWLCWSLWPWHPGVMRSVYEAAGGSEGLLRLAEAWHSRVMADEIVSHAFSHGFHPQHSQRLAAYWAEALGGPASYSGIYGDETSVVRIHSGNGPHEEMDRRAIACFDQALEDVGLSADDPVQQVLHDYFAWAATTTMSRYHDSAADVPEGLPIPQWPWDGLQR